MFCFVSVVPEQITECQERTSVYLLSIESNFLIRNFTPVFTAHLCFLCPETEMLLHYTYHILKALSLISQLNKSLVALPDHVLSFLPLILQLRMQTSSVFKSAIVQ